MASRWGTARPHGDRRQTRRGGRYDYTHVQLRREAAAVHDQSDPCTRCGQPLGPMSGALHYDHSDDGSYYLGFAHGACNLSAGAIKGRQMQGGIGVARQATRSTRDW